MRTLWNLLTGALLLVAAAHAEPLVVKTFPPGARVLIADRQYVGLTGVPLRDLSSGTYSLTLRLDDHEPLTVTVSGNDFNSGVYPPQGQLNLVPVSFGQSLKDQARYRRPFWLGLAGLAALAALVARHLMKARRRQVFLESFQPTDGEQASLIMEKVGDYRVVSTLGQGGMAEVYLAVPNSSLDMSQAVAIKVMSRWLRDRPDLVERFEREIKLSGQLIHPGIVEMRDWGWAGERLYLVMEYIEGTELRKLLPSLKGDWKQIADILSQLMQAVDFAHMRGVAHRDLKPENVMIANGRVKVMDFGLARAVDSKTLTDVGAALGTPKYIAPETISGFGAGEAADQYTLGVVAFELLTGRAPFEGDAVPFLLYSHSNLDPPAASSVNPGVPAAVDPVLARMMAKNPRDRYESVEEARVELMSALESRLCPP